MSGDPEKGPAGRFVAALRQFNRQPRLVGAARQTRERALGDDRFVDLLSTARGRPADLAAQHLVTLRGETPGFLGELGLTALQGLWRAGMDFDFRA